MKLFKGVPAGVDFRIKSEHDGMLCNAHFTRLNRLSHVAKTESEEKARQKVEEDHVAEDVSSMEVDESQEDETVPQLAVTRAKANIKQGRKVAFDSDIRFRLASATVKGVSLSATGGVTD